MTLTRPHQSAEQSSKHQLRQLRGQFQTTVVALSCDYILLLSPKLVVDLYLTVSHMPEAHNLSPLSVPSVISTDRQLAVFFCRFLFHVYVASKLFVFFASCPAFRQNLLSLVTCSYCGTKGAAVRTRPATS